MYNIKCRFYELIMNYIIAVIILCNESNIALLLLNLCWLIAIVILCNESNIALIKPMLVNCCCYIMYYKQ